MPVFIRPIVPTSNKKQYVVAPDGSVLDVGLMPVSKYAKNLLTVDDEGLCVKASDIVSRSPDNMLSVGSDGGLFISGTISPEISTDDYNYARIGRDGGLFISGNDILSNGDINLLTIDPTDHKIILTRAGLLKAMPLVSTDKGNVISSGSDGGAYLAIDDLIADDDPLLFVNGDNQIATSIKLKYNPGNGALDLIGQNGDVITSVTVPTSTSSLKGVYLLNGKPDAMGATTAGDYHFSLQYSMDNGISWGAPVPVTVTATKGMESAGTLPGVEGVNKVRAFFHGLQAESIVSANKATLVFSDETKLTVTPGIEETTFTFMPAVGIETGVFLCFVFLLSDGTVQDVYVDLSTLVDVYAPGDGISITAGDVPIISVKVKDDGGVLVDSSGLHLDLNWINSHITAPTPDVNQGNGITVTEETGAVTVSAKPKENGGVTVDADGISITIKPGGGILVGDTGLYVDEEWLEEHAPAPKEGNGISISGSTVSVKPNENGGITVDNLGVAVNVTEGGGLVVDGTGVHIDESWLADNTFKPVEGNGITISGSTISVKPKENGGIIADGTGVYVDTTWLSSQIPVYEEGEGITIAGTTVSVKPKTSGGIIVDESGISVDASWLSSQIPDPVSLSDSVSSTSSTTAASSKAVKTAYDAAQTAQTTANSAKSAASTAQSTADSASSKANSAQSTANSALSTAQAAFTREAMIGMITTFACTNLPDGWMICDGSSVLFADWPEFEQVYNEGRFTGMTLSEADPSQVGKLVLNGSAGVYLPDLEGLYEQASSAANAGGYLAAGLPNIRAAATVFLAYSSNTVSGAFQESSRVINLSASRGSDFGGFAFDFNGNAYNPIYSDSINTVQPPSVRYVRAMYLGKPNSAAA